MYKLWGLILSTILLFLSCQNREKEKVLNGLWKGQYISPIHDSTVYALENDFEFVFDRPNYSFNSPKISEQGLYNVKDSLLILETQQDTLVNIRQIQITLIKNDSLELLLKDSISENKVLFLKQ